MSYEIDFIGAGEEVKKDASAICIRWKVIDAAGNERYKTAVYDGGFDEHGKIMAQHMNKYYFDDPEGNKDAADKDIDLVLVSHPDQDHVVGLKYILENFNVKKLVMNRPWLYIDELWDKVNDGRITKKSFEERLRERYGAIAELEKIATEKKIPIVEGFQGTSLEDALLICSPSKQFYLDLLVESDKTPLENKSHMNAPIITTTFEKLKNYVLSLAESWNIELLKENVKTTADNESSIIIRGKVDEDGFLLCGDAGIRALDSAIKFLDSQGEDIKESVAFYEMPHHGSRHNVSPSILDRLIGEKLQENETRSRTAFASVAYKSDHPRRMVANAFKRRGVSVYKTSGNIIHHREGGMPKRDWKKIEPLEFYKEVEEWEQ